MIMATKYAREKKIPFFGICLGMQVAVIEFARNVLNLKANSTEFDKKTNHPVSYSHPVDLTAAYSYSSIFKI